MAINLMDEISLALAKTFPGVKVYTDNQEAGFKRPAFAIYIPNMYANKHLFGRTMRNYLVTIKYYPVKAEVGGSRANEERSQCYQMLEDWELAMDSEHPMFDFPVTNRRATITDYDNTLNIKFNARFRVLYKEDEDTKAPYMQSLEKKVNIRYGRRY